MARTIALAFGAALIAAPVASVAQDYDVPDNGFGQPDVSGFWSNVTITPFTRPRELGDRLVHTPEEVAELEGRIEIERAESNQPTDPNAPAEFEHELSVELRPEFAAGGGDVGGYNYFWLDPGDRLMRVNGEPRTSILTTPDGQIPSRIEGAPRGGFGGRGGARGYVGYEVRSYSDRCIVGFGRNLGPPMLENGFYNNNYQIVQAPDHVVILTEMIHDTRVVRLDDEHRVDDVRPWFGDSIGWYEGDTLVVETTHIPERQALYGSWENLTVTERFTRAGEDRLHYAFTIDDPTVWAEPWGGEYEFSALGDVVYEYACHEGNYALPGILRASIADAEAREADASNAGD
ncbi:MAG: hypothetical protein PVI23_14125 [Maricaulaceae bacterium]